MKKQKLSPVAIFVIALLALYTIIYILPGVSGVLQASYTAEFGELVTSDDTTGYFVRNEYVYFSGIMGEENIYIKENKLVRKGTRILEIVSPDGERKKSRSGQGTYTRFRKNITGRHKIVTDKFISQQEGIVSYHADGFESILTPETMDEKKKGFFDLLTNNDDIELKRDEVLSSDPVFKICDRSRWYIVCYVPKDSKDRYPKGRRVTVEIDGGTEIVGKVRKSSEERRLRKLIIETNYFFRDFCRTRKADVRIISEDAKGLIISNMSIVEKKGRKGVFVRTKTGKYTFREISVIATDGKQSAIESTRFRDAEGNSIETVKSHDDILRRPSKNM